MSLHLAVESLDRFGTAGLDGVDMLPAWIWIRTGNLEGKAEKC